MSEVSVSAPAAAPAIAEAPAAPAAAPQSPAPKLTPQQLIAKLKASAEPAQPAAEPADPAATPAAPVPTSREATKLAQALNNLTKAERTALEHKTAAEKHAQRVAELETQVQAFEAAKSDINKLLQYGKVTPEQLGELFVGGKLQFQPTPDAPPAPELPPEVQELVEQGRQAKQQKEREAADKAAQEARAADLTTVQDALAPLAAEYPILTALPGVADRLLDAMLILSEQTGAEPDFAKVVADANTAVIAELEGLVSNEATKKWLVEKLGLQAPAAPAKPKAGPATLTNKNTAAIPSTAKKASSSADIAAKLRAQKTGS